MRYEELAPVPPLSCIVDRLWVLEGHASEMDADEQPVLPDGRTELILHFGDAFERLYPQGVVERQDPVLFAGQMTHALRLRPTGRIAVLGVRFHAYGAACLFRIPQCDVSGGTIGLDQLSTPLWRAMIRIRETAPDVRAAIVLVERALLDVMDASRIDPRIQHVVEAIGRRHGVVSINHLAGTTGLTRRHLERQFQAQVGVSPKRLARIARFQRALRYLEHGSPGCRGSLTAAACGYADQAHFIRDFRDLAGCPPGQHLIRRGTLTGFFTGQHPMNPSAPRSLMREPKIDR